MRARARGALDFDVSLSNLGWMLRRAAPPSSLRWLLALSGLLALGAAAPARAQDVQVIVVPPAPDPAVIVVGAPEPVPPPPPTYASGAVSMPSAAGADPAAQYVPTYGERSALPAPVVQLEPSGALRVLAELGGWLLGVGATIAIGGVLYDADPDGALMTVGILTGYFVLTPAFVWAAGNLVGGRGSLGWTMLGNLVLCVFGAIGAYELSSVAVGASRSLSIGAAPALALLPSDTGPTIPLGAARFAF